MKSENEIRKLLATKLELLEKGLFLIREEFPLPNPYGSKGFIDILAKDQFGKHVIIELKRSDQAARQAIHEIFKYVALYSTQFGIPQHKIRCFIVATTWHELLVPFSQFIELSQTQTTGFVLSLNDKGELLNASVVSPLALSDVPTPFYSHCIFLFNSLNRMDTAATKLSSILEEAGTLAYLMFKIKYHGKNSNVIFPFALYLIPFRVDDSKREELIKELMEEYEISNVDDIDPLTFESEYLETITNLAYKNLDIDDLEVGHPEKFYGLEELGWNITETYRKGVFQSSEAITVDDLKTIIGGIEGQNPIRFYRTTSTKNNLDWRDSRNRASNFLQGNQAWLDGFNSICDYIEGLNSEVEVAFEVFNPMFLPMSLFMTLDNQDFSFLPSMELVAFDSCGKILHHYFGCIEWNGKVFPRSLKNTLEGICDDFVDLIFLKNLGESWLHDSQLMAANGLRYSIFRTITQEDGLSCQRIEPNKDGSKNKFADSEARYFPITKFFEQNPIFIADLMNEIQNVTKQI